LQICEKNAKDAQRSPEIKKENKESRKRKRKKNRTKVQQILDAGIKKIKIEKE